jgi:hypothetical protein
MVLVVFDRFWGKMGLKIPHGIGGREIPYKCRQTNPQGKQRGF